MRLNILTTPAQAIVPYDYQSKLVGTIHKWLGNNELHDSISLYSFSWLFGAQISKEKEGFCFGKGASWFISFYESQFVRQLVESIRNNPEMFCGLCVTDIEIVDHLALNDGTNRYAVATPILIKRLGQDRKMRYYTYKDSDSGAFMEETLRHKMEVAGIADDPSLSISFDTSYPNPKTKKVNIHSIGNIANVCPVIMKARPDVIEFARTVGLGNSTGSGFGAIY